MKSPKLPVDSLGSHTGCNITTTKDSVYPILKKKKVNSVNSKIGFLANLCWSSVLDSKPVSRFPQFENRVQRFNWLKKGVAMV